MSTTLESGAEKLTGLVSPSFATKREVQYGVVGARRVLQAWCKKSTVLASRVSFAKTDARAANVPARMAVGMAVDDDDVVDDFEAVALAEAVVFLGRCPDIDGTKVAFAGC